MKTIIRQVTLGRSFAVGWALMAISAGPVSGQWISQQIPLRPGWNAVFLEIQPEPRDCNTLFADLPVESAWRFNRRQTTVQFIDNPNELVPNAPDWLTWLPAGHALAADGGLFALEGGRPYLIKLPDTASPVVWTVKGTPINRKMEWLPDSLNFVGFVLPTNNLPSYRSFFGASAALATNKILRLQSNGVWVQVNDPANTSMQSGEAFWIRATGAPDFTGPLGLESVQQRGLSFGRVLTEQTVRVRNNSTNPMAQVAVRQLSSGLPPSWDYAAMAGSVPLSYWQNDFASYQAGWTNLPAQMVQTNLAPGAAWDLRLAVRRQDMSLYNPPLGITNVLYQSILEITEATSGARLLVGVTSEGLQDFSSGAARRRRLKSGTEEVMAGLWVGMVAISNVSQPANLSAPTEPLPTGSPLQFRILVHLDADGNANFLQRILQMWKAGQTNAQGQVIEPGRYVLVTDEKLAPQFTGAAIRDGKAVARRISTAAFAFQDPIPMDPVVRGFGQAGGAYSCTVKLPYNDRLNPFVHTYHPDHNNLDDRYQPLPVNTNDWRGPSTIESYTITRVVTLQFSGLADNPASAGSQDVDLNGTYTERISGLHSMDLKMTGSFSLHRASRTPTLNDQP